MPEGAREFSLLQNVKTGYEAHPGFFPGVKRVGSEVVYSRQSSDEVKNEWIATSTPPICLLGLTFLFVLSYYAVSKKIASVN